MEVVIHCFGNPSKYSFLNTSTSFSHPAVRVRVGVGVGVPVSILNPSVSSVRGPSNA
jgi:hypothetical protein